MCILTLHFLLDVLLLTVSPGPDIRESGEGGGHVHPLPHGVDAYDSTCTQ